MKVICISGKAQHGKDTTAAILKELLEADGKSVKIAHFADLLKFICKTYFDWDGQKDERGRHILQYVGTDVIRAKSPDYWADFIVNFLSMFQEEWDYVLLPDCRFPNEYELFKYSGIDTVLLRVERPGFVSPLTPEQQAHKSETAFLDWEHIIFATDKQMVRRDILIDDGVHNLIGGAHYKILFNRPHNRGLDVEKYGIRRAETWDEVDALVERYTKERCA